MCSSCSSRLSVLSAVLRVLISFFYMEKSDDKDFSLLPERAHFAHDPLIGKMFSLYKQKFDLA